MSHVYDQLTPERVLDAVESLGLLSDLRVIALNSYENRVYQVGIEEQQPVIVKFYRPQRWTEAQIQEEHDFSLALQALELPVVAPLSFNGKTLHQFEGFYFALFPRQGGYAPELSNLDNLYTLGRALGRIHRLGMAEPFQHRYPLSLQRYGVESVAFLLENQFIPSSLIERYQQVTEVLLQRLQNLKQLILSPRFECMATVIAVTFYGETMHRTL